MTYLFPHFLNDNEEFLECRRFWENLIGSIIDDVDSGATWSPWSQRTYADGRPFEREGVVQIVEGYNSILQRAFRIVQHSAGTELDDLAVWIEQYNDPIYTGTGFPPVELTISLVLTEDAAATARDVLTIWMDPKRSLDDLRARLERL